MRFDLQRDVFDRRRTFDVAMSVEVAEHLPEEFADRFVNLLTQLAPTVVFTASPPGAGGTEHINEQPHCYWEEKFQQRNYRNDVEVVNRWRQNWKDSGLVASCYYKNIMLFRKLSAD
jgi:hypothetical protein